MKYTNLAEVPFEEHTSRNYPVAPINGYKRGAIFSATINLLKLKYLFGINGATGVMK